MVIFNAYSTAQVCLASPLPLMEMVERLEERTGLRFMARFPGDVLHGFVTKCGTEFVVSLYTTSKKPDAESPYEYKKVRITPKLEEQIHGCRV